MNSRNRGRTLLAALGTAVLGAALILTVPAGAQAAPAGPPARPAAPASPDPALQVHPLTAAPGPVDNPLKGWAKFYSPGGNQNTGYPHALTWGYFGLSEIMTNASNCAGYNWSIIDSMLAETATYGNQAALRVYLTYPGGTGSHPANAIPACFNGNVTYRSDTYWNVTHPDYDSPFLINALKNFIAAFGARYDGDPRIGFIHLGLVGLWGEWHTWPYDTDTADGRPNYMPTDANGAQLVAAYDSAFNTTKVEIRYPDAAGGAANGRDIGYHDDSFCFREGSPLQGVTLPASMGGASYAQLQRKLNVGTENKWITSSMGGELRPEIQSTAFQYWPNGSGAVDNLKACIELDHATWMINEQSGGYAAGDANVAAAVRLMGYNLTVDNAYFKNTASGTTNVGVQVSNTGVAPFYYRWTMTLGLKDGSGNVVRTWDTPWDLRTVQPRTIRNFPDWNTGADPSYRDYGYAQYFQTSVDLSGLAQGGYQWVLRVKNPLESVNANAKKLRFANATQQADGWLHLGAATVGTSGGDTTAPSTPTGLASTGQTSSSVSLTWTAATDNVGVTGYQILRGGSPVGTSTGTSFTDTGLTASTAYSYTVKAYDAAGNYSAASAQLNVSTSAGGGGTASYEAEASGNTLSGGAVVSSCAACSGGAKVGYVGNNSGTLAIAAVAGGTGGAKTITVYYASAVARTALFNGQSVSFPATANWDTLGSVSFTLNLAAGTNTINVTNPGGWAPDLDRITVATSGGGTGPTGYEAEASGNTLSGGAAVSSCAACSGGAKVGYVGNNSGTLAFTGVAGGTGGAKTITVYYASAVARTALFNGQSVSFPATANWDTVGSTSFTLNLSAGTNTITVTNPSGWAPDLDRITVG
ncbi:DUF4832 domain-containing protein [Catellatospora tritici]|uniref:DUF4832 domain-containing protein n=1 Tax=Catellatospora tritici TaxID=2851566 RepID=UPI001C2CEE79|nr:DUF4832 domain-containing protein [Catellatospora tritici]MBV1855958.1 DUF4832 domain-containing protein [Catellatospora tritici]